MSIQTERPIIEDFPVVEEATNVKRVLEGARRLLSSRAKWCKGKLHNQRTGQYCAIGAIYAQVAPDGNVFEWLDGEPKNAEWMLVNKAIYALEGGLEEYRRAYLEIPDFNDDPDTTWEDVLNVFERAIEHTPE